MSDTIAVLDYLPEWFLWHRMMLRQLSALWRFYASVVAAGWALLPWRLGWRGVGTCVWLTIWCAYSRVLPWFVLAFRKRLEMLSP